MGLNETPAANRTHIGFFGCRNAGKSSLVNAITGQDLAVVSDTKGTTTDPVRKAMELLPMGPVMIIDTPGFDDEGALGQERMKKTKQVLRQSDVAILVVDASKGLNSEDQKWLTQFEENKIAHIIVYNKSDLITNHTPTSQAEIYVSATSGQNINELKERIARLSVTQEGRLVGDLIKPLDLVLLVTPIDESAPKGRLILPQQQTIRDILDAGAVSIVIRETELKETLAQITPALVITDSQVFEEVSAVVPRQIPLTSFSILMARYKGVLDTTVAGVQAIARLQDGDTILIAEGCTHHRQCNDIGTVKIPNWLAKSTGKKLTIETVSGTEFPDDLTKYALILHCGGCMLNEREVKSRMNTAIAQHIPFTNYGIAIAYMKGILDRSVAPVMNQSPLI
ncbi:MAG: [FeFe] hydrogenase H-cluster maturation GTPase HydF [Evtepia sp.]